MSLSVVVVQAATSVKTGTQPRRATQVQDTRGCLAHKRRRNRKLASQRGSALERGWPGPLWPARARNTLRTRSCGVSKGCLGHTCPARRRARAARGSLTFSVAHPRDHVAQAGGLLLNDSLEILGVRRDIVDELVHLVSRASECRAAVRSNFARLPAEPIAPTANHVHSEQWRGSAPVAPRRAQRPW